MGDRRPELFEAGLLGRRRDRAMGLGFAGEADFLWRIAAGQIAERLADTARSFPEAAILGTGAGAVVGALPPGLGAGRLVQIDPSARMAEAAAAARPGSEAVVDPCETLPLAEGGLDLALSVFLMQWANDPVGHLVQLRRALRPDGLMIAALFGGQTLGGLRAALATAEAELTGGMAARVAPMGELRDLGGLLQRAGFAMPVADAETVRVSYAGLPSLLRELRAMGETSQLHGRRPLRRDVLARAGELCAEHFGSPDGRIEAAFEIVFLTGWAPGPDQPVPLRPGSATERLADALGTVEVPTGEKPGGPGRGTGS